MSVIVVGMPTVSYAKSEEQKSQRGSSIVVTTKNIDIVVKRAANLIATSLNRAFFPDIPKDEIRAFC